MANWKKIPFIILLLPLLISCTQDSDAMELGCAWGIIIGCVFCILAYFFACKMAEWINS